MEKSSFLRQIMRITVITTVLLFAMTAVSVVFADEKEDEDRKGGREHRVELKKDEESRNEDREEDGESKLTSLLSQNLNSAISSVVPPNASAVRVLRTKDKKENENNEDDVEKIDEEENVDDVADNVIEEVIESEFQKERGLEINILNLVPTRVTPEDVKEFIEERRGKEKDIRDDGYQILKQHEQEKIQEDTTIDKLKEVQSTIRDIRKENEVVQRRIQDVFGEEAEKVIKEVTVNLGEFSGSDEKREFDKEKHEEVLEKVREHIKEEEKVLKEELDETLTLNFAASDTTLIIGRVLGSSLEEIVDLAREESGVSVNEALTPRAVRSVALRATRELTRQKESFNSRSGLALYRDTDEDGISDYDEENIYFTDPRNAFTAGSLLTDGERILLGFDALSTSTQRVSVDSPRTSGEVASGLFKVSSIILEKRSREIIPEAPAVDVDNELDKKETQEPEKPRFEEVEVLTFRGNALPNSFVTLYIFSTPIIVTVKTDVYGDWEYTLEEELEDGSHEMFVASVGNAGNIIAKSELIPFVKTAEAVEFAALAPEIFEDSTVVDLKEYVFWGAGMFMVILIFVALATTGVWRNRRDSELV